MKLKNKKTGKILEFSDEYGIGFWVQPEPNQKIRGYSYQSIEELTKEWEDAK